MNFNNKKFKILLMKELYIILKNIKKFMINIKAIHQIIIQKYVIIQKHRVKQNNFIQIIKIIILIKYVFLENI